MTRDTIQIVFPHTAFQPEYFQNLVSCLERDGHRCAVFYDLDAIRPALRDPRSKLLFLEGTGGDLPRMVQMVRIEPRETPAVPILLHLKQVPSDDREVLVPEFDDFLLEPLNPDDLRFRVRRLSGRFTASLDELEVAKQKLVSHFGMRQFIGKAAAFLAVIEKIPRVAGCDATVLLTGETGTGKEMCARAIHYLSSRSGGPFIPVNCASLPDHLFENELFGHAKGAFTDASSAEKGLIAEAERGTLFLDEVGSLSPSAQAKLLRFLQDREYRPLGSSKSVVANIRTVAATNADLRQRTEAKLFREDLYHRLNVLSISIPPLRERAEDIPLLANHFLIMYGSQHRREMLHLSQGALQMLLAYRWPGNVRELEGVMQRGVVLASSPILQPEDIDLPIPCPEETSEDRSFCQAKSRVIRDFERVYLTNLLAAHQGNITRAAKSAGKDRRAFQRLVRKYSLQRQAFKDLI